MFGSKLEAVTEAITGRKVEPERPRAFLVDGEVFDHGSGVVSSPSLGTMGVTVFSGDAAAALLRDPSLRHS